MFRLVILILILLWPHSLHQGVGVAADNKITVAVASSLTLPLEEIATHFKKQYEVTVQLTFASSGVLTAQIMHGAPFDVFISANLAYPQKLNQLNKTAGDPQIFTLGSLVFWNKTSFKDNSPQNILSDKNLQTLAVANPELAPFGMAAVKWLKKQHLYENIQPNLVYGENVGAVNQFIASRAVDAALTSVSALHAPQLRNLGNWNMLPASQISGIPHGVAIVSSDQSKSPPKHQSKLFADYLFSDKSQSIFKQYGYLKPGNQ